MPVQVPRRQTRAPGAGRAGETSAWRRGSPAAFFQHQTRGQDVVSRSPCPSGAPQGTRKAKKAQNRSVAQRSRQGPEPAVREENTARPVPTGAWPGMYLGEGPYAWRQFRCLPQPRPYNRADTTHDLEGRVDVPRRGFRFALAWSASGERSGRGAALWERYFHRLVELARKKLRNAPRREAAEDVASSAFDSFCRGAGDGRFPELADRDGLWRLLVVITARKAAHHRRDARQQKRGGGTNAEPLGGDAEPSLEQLISREPSPEFAAQAAEECRRLFDLLGDAELEAIARLKMEGYTIEQIAQQLGYVPRTIKRKMRLIRTLWEQEIEP